jgi:hypothetical protein
MIVPDPILKSSRMTKEIEENRKKKASNSKLVYLRDINVISKIKDPASKSLGRGKLALALLSPSSIGGYLVRGCRDNQK